jgi:hypothetical protein
MKSFKYRLRCAGAHGWRWPMTALTVLTWVSLTAAFPPEQPIPIPFFSFDTQSPSTMQVQPPFDPVHPDAVLMKGGPMDDVPLTVFPGVDIGLGQEGDELDGLSFNRTSAIRNTQFVLLFSVGRDTTGDVPPEPGLAGSNRPFNVADQVMRGHAPGDGFMSLRAFDTNGPRSLFRGSGESNAQVINNFDEGGQDYQADPPISSKDYVPAATPKDNVSSTAYVTSASSNALRHAPGGRGVPPPPDNGVYFTVTPNSESLLMAQLPGNSGADIFYDPQPDVPGLQRTFPYASAIDLGLAAGDDINALLVDDPNSNGVYDAGDRVYFSLAPGSVSLSTLQFVSSNGAADVLFAEIDSAGFSRIHLFAPARMLGLVGPDDDVDSLEIVSCGDASSPCAPGQFAAQSSIRLFPGDWNNDGVIGLEDTGAVPFCLSGPWQGVDFAPPTPLCRDIFDFNGDGDVDLQDFAFVQWIFGGMPGV